MSVKNIIEYREEKDKAFKRYVIEFAKYKEIEEKFLKEVSEFLSNSEYSSEMDYLELTILIERYVFGCSLPHIADMTGFTENYIFKKHSQMRKRYGLTKKNGK